MVTGTASATPVEGFMGLGWYIRRTPNSNRLAQWYGGVFRMPMIRGNAPTYFFWGGDVLAFELLSSIPPRPQRWTDPKTAPTVPLFRSNDISASIARLKRAGANIVGEDRHADGHDIFLLDSDDQLIGLRQSQVGPVWKEGFNPGASLMPADISSWDWTLRRVPDVAAETVFYRDVCGFPVIGTVGDRVRFQIGGILGWRVLEIAPGGKALKIVPERQQSLDSVIFRVANHDLMNARLKANHVPIVNDAIQFPSARLTYCVSPAGHLLGFEERYNPDRFAKPRDEFLEDHEANRRWRERAVGG